MIGFPFFQLCDSDIRWLFPDKASNYRMIVNNQFRPKYSQNFTSMFKISNF